MSADNRMDFDIVIVGAGPAGLSAAIRLGQRNQNSDKPLSVCVLEKAAEIGGHIISGNVLETRALDTLIPNWREKNTPIKTEARKDRFYLLTQKRAWRLPVPPQMFNHGNYIISLSQTCRWLAQEAEALGITVIPGFAVTAGIFDEEDRLIGVKTGDMGRKKDGSAGPNFQPGVEIHAQQVILAEGCRGSLTEDLMNKYQLRAQSQMQTYAIGVKEVWQVPPKNHDNGLVAHTINWPLDRKTYGGGFIYHYDQDKIALGLVIGLDYQNPYLDPHAELQRYKHHPKIAKMLQGGQCIAYASRALNEGGIQAIPQLAFPGGVIAGCGAGFLNVPKIKGTHTAMQSGIIAAETVFDALQQATPNRHLSQYDQKIRDSWIWPELHKVRNIRPGFYGGLWRGLINAAFESYVSFGHSPWTLALRKDHTQLQPAKNHQPIAYPKPDDVLSFSKLSSVRLSGTNHTEDQPCHLILQDPSKAIPINYTIYAGPEARYCPANVYEYVTIDGQVQLQINGQNCVHCKTCSIKDPTQNIRWVPPQGGEGPRYRET